MKTNHAGFVLAVTLLSVSACMAQTSDAQHANTRVSLAGFRTIAVSCAPDIPLVTLRAIARAESAFHIYALSLDYPQRTAREHGFSDGGIFLARQPGNLAEARAWTHWLLEHGRSVSIGLMQISTQYAAELGISVDQLFDPCINVRAGARMLRAKYERAAALRGEGQEALRQALSEYNSGSPTVGFENGYVNSVVDGEIH